MFRRFIGAAVASAAAIGIAAVVKLMLDGTFRTSKPLGYLGNVHSLEIVQLYYQLYPFGKLSDCATKLIAAVRSEVDLSRAVI